MTPMVKLITLIVAAAAIGFFLGVSYEASRPPDPISFDLYGNEPGKPGPGRHIGVLGLKVVPGEYMAFGLRDETHWNLIVCSPEGAVANPCGPDGPSPDEFGAVVAARAPAP